MVGPGDEDLESASDPGQRVPAEAESYFPSDQFIYRSDALAASLLTFDPIEDRVRVRFIDPDTGEARYDALLKDGLS